MSVVSEWFSFAGRIPRKTYWLAYVLVPTIINMVVSGVSHIVTDQPFIPLVVSLVIAVGGIAGGAKRCHDRDRSGWWLLIGLTGIGAIWLLIELGFLRGTQGTNRFGTDPTGLGAGAPGSVAI